MDKYFKRVAEDRVRDRLCMHCFTRRCEDYCSTWDEEYKRELENIEREIEDGE